MRKLVMAAMAASVLVLGACNTVAGAGRDVQSAGEAVEDVAN
jgi:predicted small secreted protein